MELPRVLEVGEVLGHRPSRHILRNYLRSIQQEDLIGFYMAAQKFAYDADFVEEEAPAFTEAAKQIVAEHGSNKTVKKALKDTGAAKAVAEGQVTGIVFGPAQRIILAEITRIYREYEESSAADELFNMLAVHVADGAGIDVSGLRQKEEAPAPPAANVTLSVPEPTPTTGALANEASGLTAPPHTPRGGSVDLTGKQSAKLVNQIISKRSSMTHYNGNSMENMVAPASGEKAGEKQAPPNPLNISAASKQPASKRLAFHDVVYNPLGLEMLRTFMHTEHNEENLHFHLAVRAFRRRVQSRTDMVAEAEQLWTRFMDVASDEEVTISAAIKNALREELDTNPSKTSFDSTDRSVVKTILSDVFRRFSSSTLHGKYIETLQDKMKDLQRINIVHRRGKSVQLTGAEPTAKDLSLEDVTMDNELLALYLKFCANEYSEEGILFWCAADEYAMAAQRGDSAEELGELAREIEARHLAPNAPYEVVFDHTMKRRVQAQIAGGKFTADLFVGLADSAFTSLKSDSFPRFLESPAYRQSRQLPPSTRRGFFSCVSCTK